MSASAGIERVSHPATLQLVLTALLCSAPLAVDQPWTISALGAILIAWSAWLSLSSRPPPSRALLFAIALIGVAAVMLNHRTLFGREAGLSLLALLLPLKLLETRLKRDARAVLLLCCFLLTGQFLNSQAMWVAAIVVASLIAIIAATALVEYREHTPRESFRIALRMLGPAIPIGLALFVLFPRTDGPLWGLPRDAFSGKTGLSDKMAPGSISELIQSGEIAFRAEFDGPIPPPSDRYWRGPVLTNFNGHEWTAAFSGMRQTPAYQAAGPRYTYAMTLEAHDERWLLALDFPGAVSASSAHDAALYRDDLTLTSSQRQRVRSRRTIESFPRSVVGETERPVVLNAALTLPAGSNPRTQQLGSRLRSEETSPARRVDRALAFMRQAGLLYTLNPPLLGPNTADEFLFDTRKGFCEHFAGAFAILMRAAGVPTRIVTGYQGGEVNPVDGTLVVRQSDAHAWTEVWLAGRGWIRVDPTAASAPQRIDDGISGALPASDALPFMLRNQIPLIQQLRYRLESVTNAWNQWVLGYNAQRQFDLMSRLGLPNADWRMLTALLAASGGLWLIWLALRSLPRMPRRDELDRAWQAFCGKLARRGMRRAPWEPASEFAQRAAEALPLQASAIQDIAEQYATLRYGRTVPRQTDIAALKAAIRQFAP